MDRWHQVKVALDHNRRLVEKVVRLVDSVRKRPVRSGLGSEAAGLGFFCGLPGRTVGFSPVFRAYLAGPGRTADI